MKAFLTAAFFILSTLVAQAQAPKAAPRAAATPPCTAPCTQQQLLTDVQTQFPDQTAGAITPAILRTFFNNQINSMMATSPVVGGDLACYSGTTGLPGICSGPVALVKGGTGAISQGGAATNILPAATRSGDVVYWSGSNWTTLPGNNAGTKVLQQNATGTPSWATPATFPTASATGDLIYWNGSAWVNYPGNTGATGFFTENASGAPSWVATTAVAALILPTPVRAGDIVSWNGTAWTTIPGNNAGTKFLTQDSTGTSAWASPPAGVTSVVCGTGLSGGTITATGTCAVSLSALNSALGADVALNSTVTYFPGPQVVQGTSGTWWASGTVTLSDSAVAAFHCKLWDGTTIITSGVTQLSTANGSVTMTLSGPLANPAGNINISCKDVTNTTGSIKFNVSGNSKDSSLSVARIQ
jgi:hypothetical protein